MARFRQSSLAVDSPQLLAKSTPSFPIVPSPVHGSIPIDHVLTGRLVQGRTGTDQLEVLPITDDCQVLGIDFRSPRKCQTEASLIEALPGSLTNRREAPRRRREGSPCASSSG